MLTVTSTLLVKHVKPSKKKITKKRFIFTLIKMLLKIMEGTARPPRALTKLLTIHHIVI